MQLVGLDPQPVTFSWELDVPDGLTDYHSNEGFRGPEETSLTIQE